MGASRLWGEVGLALAILPVFNFAGDGDRKITIGSLLPWNLLLCAIQRRHINFVLAAICERLNEHIKPWYLRVWEFCSSDLLIPLKSIS